MRSPDPLAAMGGILIRGGREGKGREGKGLCSYRIRGVDGSCAKHLTIASYTVVMLLTFILIIIISILSPHHSFISG